MRNTSMLILVVLYAAGSVQAVPVVEWEPAVFITADSDVNTEGTLVVARNIRAGLSPTSPGDVNPTVNGVPFVDEHAVALAGAAGNTNGSDFSVDGTNGLAIDEILKSFNWMAEDYCTFGTDLLTSGREYLVQFFFADGRRSYGDRQMGFHDGTGGNASECMDGTAQYLIGRFVADDTNLVLWGDECTGGTFHLSAYQIRVLTSGPVPTLSTTAGDPVSGNFTVDINFTEVVIGLAETDFSVSNGTVMASSLIGSGANWSVVIIPTANGGVSVTLGADSVLDGDSEPNPESNTLITTYLLPGSDQPIPTLSTAGAVVTAAYTVQINFTEAVTGLELGDFVISSNGAISDLDGSGASYSVLVTPTSGVNVTLSLPANSVTDTDGDNLQNPASNELVTFADVETIVNSPSDLLQYLGQDNVRVKLAPGTYTIDAGDVASTFGTPRFEFTGSNSTYDFTGVTINFAADVYTSGYGMDHMQIFGNNNVLKNLTMVDQCEIYVVNKKEGGTNIIMDGSHNRVEGFHMTIKGSYPYGYGDAFGKGANPVIKHKKHSALLVRGESNHVKDCTLIHKSYGHAIFMQAASNPIIEGCYVEGEVRTTDDMLAEEGTGSPADNVDFMTVWGYRLPAGYMMSTGEAGIRAYNAGTTYIDGVEIQRGTSNPTVLNCTIKYMRTGVTVAHASGTKYVEGCVAIGCENGYSLGSGDVVNCSADCAYGPVYASTYESDKNYDADITILPASDPYYNGSQSVAYIGGSSHNITLRSSESSIGEGLKIKFGGDKQNIRLLYGNLPHQNNFSASNCVIENFTNYPIDLSSGSSNITGQSCGTVTDNGSGNDVHQLDCYLSGNNVAINGTATQSSTGYEGVASKAIDGNISGVWNDGSVTHTNVEPTPWWHVDLGASYDIDQIQIYGRTDGCCQARLSDFDIMILNCNGNVVWSKYQYSYPDPSVFLDAEGTIGRYVMIQLRGSTNALSLAEVRVISENPAGYCGDLTLDGKVNLEDVAELSAGWQSGFTMDDLLNIANDWLSGTVQSSL